MHNPGRFACSFPQVWYNPDHIRKESRLCFGREIVVADCSQRSDADIIKIKQPEEQERKRLRIFPFWLFGEV